MWIALAVLLLVVGLAVTSLVVHPHVDPLEDDDERSEW